MITLKKYFNPPAIRSLVLFTFCITLFAFSVRPGGDSFEIYVNDKLMLKEFVYGKPELKTIRLSSGSVEDVLKIHYNHCGKTGSARNITIKDSNNKVLKEWSFKNVISGEPHMKFKVKEIAALQTDGTKSLSLVYSSKELPEGKVLAAILLSNEDKASLR